MKKENRFIGEDGVVLVRISAFASLVGRSPVTIRRHLMTGGSLYGWAVEIDGTKYLSEDDAAWYIQNVRRSAWDRRRRNE